MKYAFKSLNETWKHLFLRKLSKRSETEHYKSVIICYVFKKLSVV